MKNIFSCLFAPELCLSLLTGLAPGKSIVGKWHGEGDQQFEFTDDGKLLLSMGSVKMEATYTLPDDTHFKMEVDLGGKKQIETVGYEVSGDTLTTTDEHGKKESFTRVK